MLTQHWTTMEVRRTRQNGRRRCRCMYTEKKQKNSKIGKQIYTHKYAYLSLKTRFPIFELQFKEITCFVQKKVCCQRQQASTTKTWQGTNLCKYTSYWVNKVYANYNYFYSSTIKIKNDDKTKK